MSDSEDDDYPFEWRSGDLLTWFKQQPGARLHSGIQLVDLRSRGAGRGVVASEDIGEDEELFSIPLSDVLSVKTSSLNKTHLGPILQELDDWLALTLALLFEKGQSSRSKWFTYLNILPSTFDTLMYWTPPELEELRGCAVCDKIGKENAENIFRDQLLPIIRKNAYMFPQFQASDERIDVDATLLTNAHIMATLIMAYAFDLEEERKDDKYDDDSSSDIHSLPKGMVVLADMLNADGDRNNAHLVQSDDCLSMVTLKAIKQGEEIFNDYGQLPRSDLLRRYGYVTDSYKKWDVVEVDTDLILKVMGGHCRLDQQALQRRSELAQQWGIYTESFELKRDDLSNGFSIEPALYLFIDTLTMNRETFDEEITANEVPEEPRFTYEMGAALKEILTTRLRSYKTTIAEDAVLLQDDLPKRLRMAVEIRLGEKELVLAALDGIQRQMNLLYDENGLARDGKPEEIETDERQIASSKRRKT